MDNTCFPLDRQTYAKLSREELESLGKQAAVAYMSSGVSLNDAIVKIARQHPSISSHQVKRIAEFANQETFSRLFSDNEKYASDKNIEFPVADPGAILQTLNIQAEPDVINASDSEYHTGPVKTASVREVEADIELAREFGFQPHSPKVKEAEMQKRASEKDATQFADRILNTKVKEATPADKILAAGEEGVSGDTASALTQDMVPDIARQESEEEQAIKEGAYWVTDGEKVAFIPVGAKAPAGMAPPGGWGKKSMNPGQVGWTRNKATGMWGRVMKGSPTASKFFKGAMFMKKGMGGPEAVMMNAQPQQHPEITHRENMRGMERRVEIEKKKQELMAMQSKGVQAMGDQGGAPQSGAPPAGMAPQPGGAQPPPMGGMPAGGAPAPQGAPAPEPAPQMLQAPAIKKMGSLMNDALLYAKMGRPMSAQVVEDLKQAVSVDRIKEAAQGVGQYPMANPYGDLHRMQQKLARVKDEAHVARDKNEFLMKEAEDRFLHNVTQHVLEGGNLGELAHAMTSAENVYIDNVYNDNVYSEVMTKAAQHLVSKGVDPDKLSGDMLPYEMEKSAATRVPNPDHPVVNAFGSYCKLAANQLVLDKAVKDLDDKYSEVESTLTQAIQHAQSA